MTSLFDGTFVYRHPTNTKIEIKEHFNKIILNTSWKWLVPHDKVFNDRYLYSFAYLLDYYTNNGLWNAIKYLSSCDRIKITMLGDITQYLYIFVLHLFPRVYIFLRIEAHPLSVLKLTKSQNVYFTYNVWSFFIHLCV